MLSQKEHNKNVDDLFISKIKTNINLNLEDINIIESYSSKTHFYMLASLSKKDYSQKIELKKELVMSKIMGLIRTAEENFPDLSFSHILEAKREIELYPNLVISDPNNLGKKILLDSYIDIKLDEFKNRINLKSIHDKIEVQLGFKKEKKVE